MVPAKTWARMRVASPGTGAPPRPSGRMLSFDWAAVGLVALLCLGLRMTSTGLLVASDLREGGRVLACRYFTGTGVVERQRLGAGQGTDPSACPLVKAG